MGEDSKIEERKRYNAPFLAACKYLMKLEGKNQGQFAKLLGTNSSHISDWKNGRKRVSPEMMQSLLRISGGKINRFYLTGQSPYMLLENLPDEDLLALQGKEIDPDYDLLENKPADNPTPNHAPASTIDQSSAINAALSAQIELIANLKQTIADMKEQHLRELSTKDDLILSLRQQLTDLRARISLSQHRDLLADYPFEIGVAETIIKKV